MAEIRLEGAAAQLFDLGLIPGTLVSCRFVAPVGLSAGIYRARCGSCAAALR